MTAGFVVVQCMFVWVFSLFFFPPLLLLPPPPAWIRGRRKEPPSIEVRPPQSLPAVLMVGLWGTGYKGGKEAKTGRKGFYLFYLTVSNWMLELWGTGVKINSSWSALMARRRAKTAYEQGAHWHHVLVYFLFFSQQKPASRLFVFYFWQSPRWEWWRSAVFPLVYLSLGLLLFKCENAGNYLAAEMWVYRKSLGRPVLRHSFYLSVLSPCQWPVPSPASVARTFSSNFLPCVCPIAAIDSWTVLMWPRLHSQHITLPLVTLPLFPVQADINWLD